MSSLKESRRQELLNFMLRLIEECANMRELKEIHTRVIKSPPILQEDKPLITSRLLYFCAISKSGSLSYANTIFRSINNPNQFVYNVMIRACATSMTKTSEPHSYNSLLFYRQMRYDEIAPTNFTFPFLVKECSFKADFLAGSSVHAQTIRFGFRRDVFVQNSLISFYSAGGCLSFARQVFDEMPNRDVVSWNSMIVGCLRAENLDEALNLFWRMRNRNVISWNTIISGFVQGGRPNEAFELFQEMLILESADLRIRPDKITFSSVLSACARIGAIDHGKWVHDYLKKTGLECDIVIETALIDMYGKCGSVERACEVFEQMNDKDTLAYTAMISTLAFHGCSEQAFEVFKDMEMNKVKPNDITFIGLLSACSHSGLVEKGRWCFEAMKPVYSVEPKVYHYACLVDILGRAGFFKEAENVIREMPMKPDLFVWGALLGACQMHGNVKLGEFVAKYLIDLEPKEDVFYVNLCDIYTKCGRMDDAKRVRRLMKRRGIKKEMGCSWIEINGVVREFLVRGSNFVKLDRELQVLNVLHKDMNRKELLICD